MKIEDFSPLKYLNSRQFQKYFALMAASGMLASCGGSGQDVGTKIEFSQEFSGVAVDGYLARATVFVDTNNNGTRDAWEAWAFTDNDGYYSYNPKTDTNYCASNATAQQAQYCLVSNVAYSNVVIRIDSGYDVLTGEPFLGQMSRRVNAEVLGEVSNTVVSPITSLLSNVEQSTDREALLTSLSITEDDLNVDYLNSDGADTVNAPLLNTALKIHKVVSVLSDRLTDTYTEIGEDFGTPNDASSSVYPNLAQQIINAQTTQGLNLDQALSDESTLVSTLDAAETTLREVYERKEFTLPADMGDVTNTGAFERVVQVANELPAVVNTLIDINDTNFNLEDATGTTRALESLVIKTVNETAANRTTSIDTSIDNAVSFFDTTDDEDQEAAASLVETLVASLTLDSADVGMLVANDFAGDDFDDAEEISNAANVGEDVQPFTQIGGLKLRVSDLDLGSAPNNLDDSEVEFYFNGEASDIEGAFSACVKYIDGASSDGTLGDGNTRGELVDGFWSMLGASEGDAQSYSVLLTLTFLGTTYQAILKPAGMETVDQVEYHAIRFDQNGEIKKWHSAEGFVEISSLPTSNAACQTRLPSRIGI